MSTFRKSAKSLQTERLLSGRQSLAAVRHGHEFGCCCRTSIRTWHAAKRIAGKTQFDCGELQVRLSAASSCRITLNLSSHEAKVTDATASALLPALRAMRRRATTVHAPSSRVKLFTVVIIQTFFKVGMVCKIVDLIRVTFGHAAAMTTWEYHETHKGNQGKYYSHGDPFLRPDHL